MFDSQACLTVQSVRSLLPDERHPVTATSRTTARFGRARFGGGSVVLLLASAAVGAVLAAGLGLLFAWLGEPGGAGLRFTVMTAVTLPVAAALAWAALIDRASLPEATERPEDSVEAAWYDRAARGAFLDAFVTISLAAAAFSITGLEVDTGMLLLVVSSLMVADFAVRFLLAKRTSS